MTYYSHKENYLNIFSSGFNVVATHNSMVHSKRIETIWCISYGFDMFDLLCRIYIWLICETWAVLFRPDPSCLQQKTHSSLPENTRMPSKALIRTTRTIPFDFVGMNGKTFLLVLFQNFSSKLWVSWTFWTQNCFRFYDFIQML